MFKSPVLELLKNCNWTRPRLQKTKTDHPVKLCTTGTGVKEDGNHYLTLRSTAIFILVQMVPMKIHLMRQRTSGVCNYYCYLTMLFSILVQTRFSRSSLSSLSFIGFLWLAQMSHLLLWQLGLVLIGKIPSIYSLLTLSHHQLSLLTHSCLSFIPSIMLLIMLRLRHLLELWKVILCIHLRTLLRWRLFPWKLQLTRGGPSLLPFVRKGFSKLRSAFRKPPRSAP